MKLYYAPGACSLACRISLHEGDITADYERVDLRSKITEHGEDYTALNAKGSVPMLVLDNGEAVTEAVAILMLIADREGPFESGNPLAPIRMIEMLSYLSSEVHIAFKPFWHAGNEAQIAKATAAVDRHFTMLSDLMQGRYLFGPRFTVADAYLFVMLRWAKAFGLRLPLELEGFFERVSERPAVRQSLAEEGLSELARA